MVNAVVLVQRKQTAPWKTDGTWKGHRQPWVGTWGRPQRARAGPSQTRALDTWVTERPEQVWVERRKEKRSYPSAGVAVMSTTENPPWSQRRKGQGMNSAWIAPPAQPQPLPQW